MSLGPNERISGGLSRGDLLVENEQLRRLLREALMEKDAVKRAFLALIKEEREHRD